MEGAGNGEKGIQDPQIQKVYDALNIFDPDVVQSVLDLVGSLDVVSAQLGRDQHYRHKIGQENPYLWTIIRRLWIATVRSHEESDAEFSAPLAALCQSLAKFTRNLVAAEPLNQERSFKNEPYIRTMLYLYTSYAAMQNTDTFPVTRMLVQTLSNLVTTNEPQLQRLWETYMSLPEEQLVLIRLFASPDPRTITSTFVLILNCMHENRGRTKMLVHSPRGPRVCICMLDRLDSLVDAEESSDFSNAFDVGYQIFSGLIEQGDIPDLYQNISLDDEVITPHQTTLLKLLDSYLQRPSPEFAQFSKDPKRETELVQMLTANFFALSAYTQQAIQRALGSGSPVGHTGAEDTSEGNVMHPPLSGRDEQDHSSVDQNGDSASHPLQELDLLLPKACEALVLVTQCLISLMLNAEEAGSAAATSTSAANRLRVTETTSTAGEGLVETIISTLRLLDVFIPRITFGKVVQRPTAQGLTPSQPSTPGRESDNVEGSGPQSPGFSYVKRDLVRLLGILASDNKTVQDRVRLCGGIPVVMNLCVIDDQNPYLKEHAIYTLRNLLHGNKENQNVVNEIQPVGRWDESHILQGL